jgi:hypothetical protein
VEGAGPRGRANEQAHGANRSRTIITKSIAAIAALSIGTLAFAGSAEAHHHWNNGGGVAAGGIIGFAAGAMVGSALAQPRTVVVEPAYGYPDWVSYCLARHRSFDPRTGLYLGHDGYYHECR